jgi:hypothetical protein
MDNFARDLQKAIDIKIIGQAKEFAKSVAISAFRDISATANEAGGVFGSPLWSGRFRASNNISVGSPDFSVLPPNPSAKNHPTPVASPYKSNINADATPALQSFKLGDTIYIANGLPYARRIEFDGWSAQVPNGVFKVAKERVRAKYKDVKLGA